MQETLEPIRNRRKEFSKDIPAIYEMLQQGCEVARAAAAETLADNGTLLPLAMRSG